MCEMMPTKDIPRASLYINANMDSDDEHQLLEEELELVPDGELDGADIVDIDEEEGGDDDKDEDDVPPKDDATLVFRKHEGSVFCCKLEPTMGNLAVTGGEDDKAYVWETHSGNVVLTCDGHEDSVTCVEFNRDGSYLATGDMGGVVRVWKLSSKTVAWETNVGDLVWLKWHHGTNVLLAGGDLGDVYMWRIPSGECKVLPGSGSRTDCGLVMPDGKRAVIGYQDESMKVFDLKTASVLHHITCPTNRLGNISCMDAHPDNNLIICSSCNHSKMAIVSTHTGKILSLLGGLDTDDDDSSRVFSDGIEAVAFSRDGSLPLAATGHIGGSLYVWDIARHAPRSVWVQSHGLSTMVWDKNSPVVYMGGLDGNVRAFDCRSETQSMFLSGHQGDILDLCLSTDSSMLLTASDDGTARVFTITVPDR